MLFENREQMKEFAKALAKKMLERRSLDEWRKLAERANRAFSGHSCFPGMRRHPPLPLGTYTKALNKMHFAVNGIRPYAEAGGGGGGQASREPDPPECGNPHARPCALMGTYNVCECDYEGYACAIACIRPDRFTCNDVFKCPSGVSCDADSFQCGGVFWQDDQGCPTGATYTCDPAHVCRESESEFYSCATYDCHSVYNCEGQYRCPRHPYTCDNTYHCVNEFSCEGEIDKKFSCGVFFTCQRTTTFSCTTNEFDTTSCTPGRDFICGGAYF
jgi:hypothetical protein